MKIAILDSWDDLLELFPEKRKDIYFSKRYISLYEAPGKKAQCVVCRDEGNVMLMPFIRGEISGYYDFETAYGYGGPIANTDNREWCGKALHGIHEYLQRNSYLCGFTRFHPLLCNETLAACSVQKKDSTDSAVCAGLQVLYDRQTVAIDTSQSVEDIWNCQISSKNRNMIRKAEKNQLVYKAEKDFASYEEFIDLYHATMRRLCADRFYFFDRTYFDSFRDALSGNSFLGTIRKDGKLICAAIFMHSKLYGHYHLEGSDSDYSGLGANNYLLWNVACQMHEMGVIEFHLGGGTSSAPEDSLYRFKKAFSRNEKRFYIGKEVFNNAAYSRVCDSWERKNPEKIKEYGNRLWKYRY